MTEWKECKLGDEIELNYGKGLKKSLRVDGNIPVFGSNGIVGYHNESLVKGPGIIVGRKGSLGEVKFSPVDFFPIDTTYYVTTDIDNDIKFLFYFLLTLNLSEMNSHSAVPGLNRNDVYSLDICIPPLPEQKAIAGVLSSLDDKINLLHRQNKALEAIAETLFRQWFIEEAREDWETKKLGDLMTITSSKRIYYSEYVESGIPFYRSKEIIELQNSLKVNNELFIKEERYNEIKEKFGIPYKGDILLTSVGTLGIPYRVKDRDKFYFKDGNLTWFREFNTLPSIIIYFWIKSSIGQEEIQNSSIGSTQQALTIKDLKNIDISIPTKEIITQLKYHLEGLNKKIESNLYMINSLEKLRDTLLPKLMSGEVRVNCN